MFEVGSIGGWWAVIVSLLSGASEVQGIAGWSGLVTCATAGGIAAVAAAAWGYMQWGSSRGMYCIGRRVHEGHRQLT